MKNNNLHIGQLPELRIVTSESIIFHEQPDRNISEKLVTKITQDGFLKNPPIVGKTTTGEYILLDGANRTNALIRMDIKHICVQTINMDDPLLTVSAWSHAIEGSIRDQLLQCLDRLGVAYLEQSSISNKNVNLAEVVFKNGAVLAIPRLATLPKNISLLHSITKLYLHQGRMDRVSYYRLGDLIRNYKDFSALFSYAEIEKTELVKIALSGEKMPSGITRIQLPKRVLNFNIPIDVLAANKSLLEKNNWLNNNILERKRANSIRFYREPTFIFDD
ncbi:MAG: hypothetical protein HQ528_00210 [Candidatus Marinimicrobia bacterium]|nr:hypothetical protein [Candidatus Neomarinimicrobiota bacterium]